MAYEFYKNLHLKPLSMSILKCLYLLPLEQEMTAEKMAQHLNVKVRAVDAAFTKSLQAYGLAKRIRRETPLKKKGYNILQITDSGMTYLKVKEGLVE